MINLTYEEYIKLIPEQTKKMLEEILPYLWLYIKRNRSIKLKNKEAYDTNDDMRIAISALLGAAKDPEIKSMFESQGFSPERINISQDEVPKLSLDEKREIFEQSIKLFTPYDDITKYTTIEPIDLIHRALTIKDDYYFSNVFKYIGFDNDIEQYISNLVKKSNREKELQLERELFEGLPISTINYLEAASKIRTIIISLYKHRGIEEQELLKNDDSYIIPISLLMALYEYDGYGKDEVINFFQSKGISSSRIRNHLSGFTTQNIKSTNRNLECVKELYKRYWTTGVNKDAKPEDIQVVDILSNVLDRNFTGVVTIDKLFEKLGTSTAAFANLKQSIEAEIAQRKSEEEMNYAKSFYKDLRRDTKDFINLTTKTYQLLLKKMQEGKHNSEILNCSDDADTLALYIASHFYNTTFERFYVEHGVTFDKVMSLLGISITKEEIEQEELNQKTVVDIFKRFVTSGVNTNKRPENISVDNVAYNLCNRDFNRSMIMENIFEEIRRDIDLPANFMNTIEQYFNSKEVARKRKLTEEFFGDKSNDIYNFFENACKAYESLKHTSVTQKYQDDDLVPIAFLYALFSSTSETKEIYHHLGLTKETLNRNLNIDMGRYSYGELDIDLILSKFIPYIAAVSEDETKEELTVSKIGETIFTSKRPKSLQLTRLLAQNDLTYSSFDDLTTIRHQIATEKEQQKIESEANSYMKGFNGHATNIMKYATRVFTVLEKAATDSMPKMSPNDMADISLLLGILQRTDLDSYKYFEKYNIKDQDIIGLLNLPVDLNSKTSETEYSPKQFLDHFKQYGNNASGKSFNQYDILNNLLSRDSSVIKGAIEALGIDYDVLKRECLTQKDYESTLTLDDRRNLLGKEETPELIPSDAISILMYGSALQKHTSFINNQCTDLVLKDQKTEQVESIQSILERVYEKRLVPVREPKWYEKLIGKEVETSEEVRVNGYAISDLKECISSKIAPIYEDVKTLDALTKYLEVYRHRVNEYQQKAAAVQSQLEEERRTVSEDEFEKVLRLKAYARAVEARREGFELTDHLVKQYIYRAYLVMENDLVTITGLEISRDVLIPLLEGEVILGNSIQNQTTGARVTENVVRLLSEVINKNSVGIQEGLEAIKESGISEEQLLILNRDVKKYLKQLGQTTDPNTVTIEELPQQVPVLELEQTQGHQKVKVTTKEKQ